MAKIQIKRGAITNLPQLDEGELAFTSDTKKLYIGTNTGNYIPADMRTAVYDTTGNGIVDNSEKLQSRALHELDHYNLYRSNKDSNGIFTTIEYKRYDGTLFIRSILSGGTSPIYTTRTVTYYDTNGTTVLSTKTYTLSYDADDALLSEVAS